ncbi:MAG: Ig-like domain-containing protein, partial [Planctomycetes bacterium]|nr:Ig-like domain-containing protein [Planctomycetota bacterium]
MLFRITAPLALFAALTGLAGCSGGSAAVGTAKFSCAGDNPEALCLHSCNLGCSSTGCLRTTIAQNEIVILYFSDDVDPATVNHSTIRFRTAAGAAPVGEFFVNHNKVEFVPTLLISGNETFFGFRPNETYSLTIPGGPGEAETVRSTSGYAFNERFTCSVVASDGIRDLNEVAPTATLVSPSTSQLDAAPLDTIIRLEFNEMVDVTPFRSGSPVTFDVRRTFNGSNGRECNGNSQPTPLPGTPRLDFDPSRGISILTFRPQSALPSNICVEINVTSDVVDLSGKPAQPQRFRFLTEVLPLSERNVTEEFEDDQFLDRDNSGGSWSGGSASFAKIGGDGRHGVFTTDIGNYLGVVNGKHTYEINTDAALIPAEQTFTGTQQAVTNGEFFFSRFTLDATTRLKFIGSHPPIINVSGRIDILGEIDVQGESLPYMLASSAAGQDGGDGGIFGAAGGRGGDKCLGNGGPLGAYQGRDGESANILAGRGYASSAASSGGQGSDLFPLSGLSSAIFFGTPTGVSYSPSGTAGGGGGGLWQPGENGRVVTNDHIDPLTNTVPRRDVMGPVAPGGTAVQFFPFPPPSGSSKSSVHFLVGGSGGGGAASNAALSIGIGGAPVGNSSWAAGGGGG